MLVYDSTEFCSKWSFREYFNDLHDHTLPYGWSPKGFTAETRHDYDDEDIKAWVQDVSDIKMPAEEAFQKHASKILLIDGYSRYKEHATYQQCGKERNGLRSALMRGFRVFAMLENIQVISIWPRESRLGSPLGRMWDPLTCQP